jgi:hypothetical protein
MGLDYGRKMKDIKECPFCCGRIKIKRMRKAKAIQIKGREKISRVVMYKIDGHEPTCYLKSFKLKFSDRNILKAVWNLRAE